MATATVTSTAAAVPLIQRSPVSCTSPLGYSAIAMGDFTTENTSASEKVPTCHTTDSNAPLLTQYDPYHETTYFVHHPLAKKPLSTDEMNSYALLYGSSAPSWKLNYQDFCPRVTGLENGVPTCNETYQDLVEQANSWLRQNPQFQVKSFETVRWWSSLPLHVGDTEQMVLQSSASVSSDEDAVYLTGLRLWLVPQKVELKSSKINHQQLRVRDFYPSEKEGISHLIKRVNRHLEDQPCSGKILNVETVYVPDLPGKKDSLLWRNSHVNAGRFRYIVYLRVIFVEGAPALESIGIRDFVPDQVQGGYEPFSNLVKKASRWINEEKAVNVTNFKSIHISKENDNPQECAERCVQYAYDYNTQPYFQVLRVFYVRKLVQQSASYYMINYVTFTPVQMTAGPSTLVEFERMRQTLVRVTAWLLAAGATVFSVETIITPLVPQMPTQTLPEITYWTPTSISNEHGIHKCLMQIRVYIEGEYREPDPRQLPPLPHSLTVGLQIALIQREREIYYAKKRKRRRKKRIIMGTFVFILVGALALILFDQAFGFFGL